MRAPPRQRGAALTPAPGMLSPILPPPRGCCSAAVRAPPCTQGAALTPAPGMLSPILPPPRGCCSAAVRAPPSKLGAALTPAPGVLHPHPGGLRDKCFASGGRSGYGWPEPLRGCLPRAVAAARGRAHITRPPSPTVRVVSALPRQRGAAATPRPPIYCAGYDRFPGLRRAFGLPNPLYIINTKSTANIW